MCWFLYFQGHLIIVLLANSSLEQIARTGTVKMPNFLASWQPSERRDAGAAERTGLENRSRGNSTGGSNPPLSATLSRLISRLPALLFLNRTIVEYSWRVRSSLFSVRYCDIQHLIRYGSDRKVSSENLQLFSRFLIGHHYSFRHWSYETAAKLLAGTEVA